MRCISSSVVATQVGQLPDGFEERQRSLCAVEYRCDADHERAAGRAQQAGVPPEATHFLSGRNEPMRDPREWFDSACEEAKIEGVTWHTVRHTFGSRLVMAGVPLNEVSELMGQKTLAMTRRYAHLAPEHKLNALERLVPKGTRRRAVEKECS